jgi:exodeoxyribonuclease V alpha subunit
MIVVNAHRVNQGEFPILKRIDGKESSDFFFIEEEEPDKILDKIVGLCGERIPQRFGFHPVRDIQVLTPMHKGLIGVSHLNLELQKKLNPNSFGITFGNKDLRLGDKVMQIVNNYEKDVFNGDIGWIVKIDQEDQELTVDFDSRLVTYDFSDLDEIVLSYAISIHKSQGSEYPAVVMAVSTQHYLLLQRNLIYTGITRAKKLVVIIGTPKALAIAIGNNKTKLRFTRLSEKLQGF